MSAILRPEISCSHPRNLEPSLASAALGGVAIGPRFPGPGVSALAAALVAFLVVSLPLRAQQILEIKDFQSAEHFGPPFESQIKSLLKGSRARPLENERVQVFEAELRTFRTNGTPELLLTAPECVYDQRRQTADSAGPVHARTADGKYSIAGQGFLWEQTNSTVFISNRVHTIVETEFVEAPVSVAPGAARAPSNPLHIYSRAFEYHGLTGLGAYHEDVRVSGTNLQLTAGELTLKAAGASTNARASSLQMQTITAEHNVALDYSGIQATGQLAVYSFETGLARVTGHPSWRSDLRQGRGDELIIDRTNKIFQANGHAWLRLPGQSFGSSDFLSRSNGAAGASASTTNRFVEIVSDAYEFRTNWAVFRDQVRVTELATNQPGGTMVCARLTATFTGTNELQQLVAQTNVVIQQEQRRFTGQQAVFSATNGVLELTGKPTWQDGLREGRGEVVRVETRRNAMQVRGNASMRLPADELGQASTSPGPSSMPPPPKPGAPTRFADIFCADYALEPGRAVFHGGVYATHPRMNWACETLTVFAPAEHEKILDAEDSVSFDLLSEKGDKIHGTGDKAVYTNSVTSTFTNDVLTLTGRPARLTVATGTITNNLIVFDRARNQLIGRGGYRVFGTVPAPDTNLFSNPSGRKKR